MTFHFNFIAFSVQVFPSLFPLAMPEGLCYPLMDCDLPVNFASWNKSPCVTQTATCWQSWWVAGGLNNSICLTMLHVKCCYAGWIYIWHVEFRFILMYWSSVLKLPYKEKSILNKLDPLLLLFWWYQCLNRTSYFLGKYSTSRTIPPACIRLLK